MVIEARMRRARFEAHCAALSRRQRPGRLRRHQGAAGCEGDTAATTPFRHTMLPISLGFHSFWPAASLAFIAARALVAPLLALLPNSPAQGLYTVGETNMQKQFAGQAGRAVYDRVPERCCRHLKHLHDDIL